MNLQEDLHHLERDLLLHHQIGGIAGHQPVEILHQFMIEVDLQDIIDLTEVDLLLMKDHQEGDLPVSRSFKINLNYQISSIYLIDDVDEFNLSV